ncbi:MAG: glycerate kinase [Bifidobacteriaceae bacterium]|nr:glycerate kinase [Bifidobacteriaceae bacterium]
MLILVAPDSFKGSLSAAKVAAAMVAGARVALPDADLAAYPMADGGEGTIDALTSTVWPGSSPGTPSPTRSFVVRDTQTVDALGRPHTARYAMGHGGRAIVELAQASGLPQVADHPAPLTASTRGTGLVIARALEGGARDLLICLGGTATTDGGAGILRALGARLLDARDHEVDDGGAALARISRIDVDALAPGVRDARWRLACDVDNPLTGPRGAAAVFGPQKGASPTDVARLDAALGHWAEVLARDVGPVDPDVPGMGAAGGTPAALVAAFGARLVPGARLVADVTGLTARLARADLLITGEGSFDGQSLAGKVVGTLAGLARSAGVPVLVVAGAVRAGAGAGARPAGIVGARSIADGPCTLDDLMTGAAHRIETTTADMLTTFAAGMTRERTTHDCRGMDAKSAPPG